MAGQHVLDTDDGLERLMGDAGLYGMLLKRFRKDYEPAVAQMRQLLADGSVESAQRKAHSMKGAAGMIGAQELQGLAGLAEAGLGTSGAARQAGLDALQAGLDKVLLAITAYLSGADGATSAAAPPASPQPRVPDAQAHALLTRLARLLEDGNGEAIDVLEQSATLLAATLGLAGYREVAAAAHEFDFETALAALTKAHPTLSA
jgi:HPt (histidine-containing phosphotransfer) domain-containing protein